MDEKRKAMLIGNDFDWYVVDYDDSPTCLVHNSGLSNILQCGQAKEDFGITKIEQCWNGEDLDY